MRDRLEKLRERLFDHVENLVLLAAVDSTHAMTRRLISDMDEQEQSLGPTVIAADSQDAGQGRDGRSWQSPAGGLYVNWLRSSIDSRRVQQLPMLASAAVHSAVSSLGVTGARIKWPNDILVGNRKLAGVLVFARHGETNWVSVGLGINIDSTPVLGDDHPIQATSLKDEIGGECNGRRDDLLVGFITALGAAVEEPEPALEVWRRELVQKPGDTVSLRMASGKQLTGSLLEVTEEGFLRLDVDGEERTITGGDIIEGEPGCDGR